MSDTVSQAVILAAGRGTRMGHLTNDRPKCMLEVAGRPLIEYKFRALPETVDEIIIVINYLGSVIHDRFGGEYEGRRLLYVEQDSPTGGTADALWQAKDLLHDRFFVMNADNLYDPKDFENCLPYEWAVVVQKTDHVRTGRVVIDRHHRIAGIDENTHHEGGAGWANTGLYLLNTRIFASKAAPKAAGSAELGLPQTIVQAAHAIHIQAVPTQFWMEIKEPEDLARAEQALAGTF